VNESERREWLLKFRAEWFRTMRPLGGWVPWELRGLVTEVSQNSSTSEPFDGLITPAPQLSQHHLRNCAVVPTRTDLLARLPKGGVVAELGVLHGAFSREILAIVQPDRLHLIDREITDDARALEREHASVVIHRATRLTR
jgi:hypothetical protein